MAAELLYGDRRTDRCDQANTRFSKFCERAETRYRVNALRTGSFKLFKRPFPGFLTILTL